MLFRSISLPSISGHFRFGSIRFNALPQQLFSLLGFAPAIRRCSLPRRFISSLSFSSAALFSSHLISSVPQPFHAIQFLSCSTPCYSHAMPGDSIPMLIGALLFSAFADDTLLFRGITFPCFSLAPQCFALPLRVNTIPARFYSALFHATAMRYRSSLFLCLASQFPSAVAQFTSAASLFFSFPRMS